MADRASINITANDISIDAPNAVVAFSEGIVDLDGDVKINAPLRAITARGNSHVVINKSGEHTTKIDGDISFNYHAPTSGTSVDAVVDVTFAGADSYWTGNTVVAYTNKPADIKKLQVSNSTITLTDGATWNATQIKDILDDAEGVFYTALNNLTIDNGTVNIADKNRGIQVDTANIKNGTFTGGHIQFNETGTVADSVFKNSQSDYSGAVKTTIGSKLSVSNSKFIGNSALSTGAMGVFGTGEILNSTFTNNIATDATDEGAGAVFLGASSQSVISGSTFNKNKSESLGGAIATRTATGSYNNSAATLDISDSIFNGNIAATDGGAIYNAFYHSAGADAVMVSGTLFNGNQAANGGAIYNDGAQDAAGNTGAMRLENVSFTNNYATTKGGAIYNTGKIELLGTNAFSGNRVGNVANDIYNDGVLLISGGDTTLTGGITGDGSFTLSDGAILNLGTGSVSQKTLNINGTVNAIIVDDKRLGRLLGDVVFSDDAKLNLNVSTAGVYKIFDKDNNLANAQINAGTLFDVKNNGADGVVISTRATDDIAADTGLSNKAAATLVGVANSGNAVASVIAQRALGNNDIDYIESESAKAQPHEAPVVHSVATSVQNQVLSLVASRMVAGSTGRSGGDFVTTGAGMWAHGLINKTKMNDAFRGDTHGLAVGIDMVFNRQYTFGMGYAHGDTDVNSNAYDTDINSDTLFAYAQYKPAKWFINGAFNYTFADYTTATNVFGMNINSNYDVNSYGGQIMTGYDFASGVTPSAGVRYLYITADDYNNGISDIKSDDTNFMTGVMGMKYAFDINGGGAFVLRPELRAAATYDFISDDSIATVLLPGASAYIVNADRLSRMGGEFGIGMTALVNGWEISVNYDLDLHKDYTSQSGLVKFKYNF